MNMAWKNPRKHWQKIENCNERFLKSFPGVFIRILLTAVSSTTSTWSNYVFFLLFFGTRKIVCVMLPPSSPVRKWFSWDSTVVVLRNDRSKTRSFIIALNKTYPTYCNRQAFFFLTIVLNRVNLNNYGFPPSRRVRYQLKSTNLSQRLIVWII